MDKDIKTDEIETYLHSVRHLAEEKSSFRFDTSKASFKMCAVSAMLENATHDFYMYESHLNDFSHNNEIFVDALKKFLKKNLKLYVVICEENFSDDFIKLYKAYGLNIYVKKASDKFVLSANSMLTNKDSSIVSFYVSSNMSGGSIKNSTVINNTFNFNDKKTAEKINEIFSDFYDDLEKIQIIQNRKLPGINEVIKKFKHVKISQENLIDIVEFSQGKNN